MTSFGEWLSCTEIQTSKIEVHTCSSFIYFNTRGANYEVFGL